jgi:hypothetical protein
MHAIAAVNLALRQHQLCSLPRAGTRIARTAPARHRRLPRPQRLQLVIFFEAKLGART